MARIRTIKPGFFKSLTIGKLPKPCRLTFIGLWTCADDAGRLVDDLRLIKAEVWPLDDDYTLKKIETDLTLLEKTGRLERYAVDGRRYLRITTWAEHQRINRPQPSALPASPTESVNDHGTITEDSVKTHGTITERSVNDHGTITDRSPREGKGREGKGIPPTPLAGPQAVAETEKPKSDRRTQEPEPQPPPPPAAVPLIERWLTVVENPQRPLQRIEAQATIAHLLDHLDSTAIDEVIGRCQAEAREGDQPRRAKYLLIAARHWAAQNGGITIPDIPIVAAGPVLVEVTSV